MTLFLALAILCPLLAQPETGQQASAGCENVQPDAFVYIGVQNAAVIPPQKYTLKKPRGRSVMGVPIPGGSSGRPRYQVKVSGPTKPVTVGETRPVFHVSSKNPAERLFLLRLLPCGKEGCFSLYEDGPAVMSLVRTDIRQLGPECYELCPQQSLTPGDYALVILTDELKPRVIAPFTSGQRMPEFQR